jgi:hypothetical protein
MHKFKYTLYTVTGNMLYCIKKALAFFILVTARPNLLSAQQQTHHHIPEGDGVVG